MPVASLGMRVAEASLALTHSRRRLHTTSAPSPATGDLATRAPSGDTLESVLSNAAPVTPCENASAAPTAARDPAKAATDPVTESVGAAANGVRSVGMTQPTDGSADATSTVATETTTAEREREERGWRRMWRSFKSEGKDFSLFYFPFYPATFLLLYAAFATEALHKEAMLDYVLLCMGDYVDRDTLYARIEAWNTWANLGFAFVINELLEVIRFPAVIVLYYATKPYSTRFANWLRQWMPRLRRTKSSAETPSKT